MSPFIAMTALLAAGAADAAEADFDAAADAVLAGRPEAAVGLLRSLVDRGYGSADVYYDLGYALEEADRPIEAVIAYERALAVAPDDEDARTNLARLRARWVPDAPRAEPLGLSDAVGPWTSRLPIGPIGWVSAGLLALLGLARGLGRRLPFEGPAAGLASGGLLLVALAGFAVDHRAVVREPTPLLEGPDRRFASVAELGAGEGLRVLDPSPGAYWKVQRADGVVGYATRSAVVSIQPRSP